MIALRLLLLEKDSDSAVGYLHLEKELGDHDKMGGMTPIVDKWKSKSSYTPPPTTTLTTLSPHYTSPYYLLPSMYYPLIPSMYYPLIPTTNPPTTYYTSPL